MNKTRADGSPGRTLITAAITSTEFLARARPQLDTSLMESPHLRLILGWCYDHYDKYQEAPGKTIEDVYYDWCEKLDEEPEESQAIRELLGSLSDDYEQEHHSAQYYFDATAKYVAKRRAQALREEFEEKMRRGDVEGANELIAAYNATPAITGGDNFYGDDCKELTEDEEDIDLEWLWDSYIARGHITLFSALFKAGKTTFMDAFLRACNDGGHCITEVAKTKVLYITEEIRTTWKVRESFYPNVKFYSRPLSSPSQAEWEKFITATAKYVEKHKIDLVVIDTLPYFWPVENENDASDEKKALVPLHVITKTGAAVMLVHHMRKGDGAEGRGVRGSSFLPGFVDITMEMRRHNAQNENDRKRVITTCGKYTGDKKIVIELQKNGSYKLIGSKADAKGQDLTDAVREIIAEKAMSVNEMLAAWPDGGIAKPGGKGLRTVLEDGVKNLRWRILGTGKCGDPNRFEVVQRSRKRHRSDGA